MNSKSESKIKPSEIVKRIIGALWWIALAALAVMMFNIMGAKMQGKVPKVFGYAVVNIISGSMEDTIPEGSYILVKEVAPEEVRQGDIICFYSTDPTISGIPNTHRVVAEPIITDDGIEFVTKGDANTGEDKYNAHGDKLIGRYVRQMDLLGDLVSMLDGGGLNVLFIALEVMIVAMVVSTFLRARKEANEADEKKAGGEQTLSEEEIKKMIGENPELVREIEESLALSSVPGDNNKDNG